MRWPLQNYHRVWLAAHPERTEEWLRARLEDGFDIHHVDGNHDNDERTNLVLIEGGDHQMLHGRGLGMSRALHQNRPEQIRTRDEKAKLAAEAYRLFKRETGWVGVAKDLGLNKYEAGRLATLAKAHAAANGLIWPIP